MTDSESFYAIIAERMKLRPEWPARVSAFVRDKTGHADLAAYNGNGAPEADKVSFYRALLAAIWPPRSAPQAPRRPANQAKSAVFSSSAAKEAAKPNMDRDAFALLRNSQKCELPQDASESQKEPDGRKTHPPCDGLQPALAALQGAGKSPTPELSTKSVLVDALRGVAAQSNHSVTLRVGDVYWPISKMAEIVAEAGPLAGVAKEARQDAQQIGEAFSRINHLEDDLDDLHRQVAAINQKLK